MRGNIDFLLSSFECDFLTSVQADLGLCDCVFVVFGFKKLDIADFLVSSAANIVIFLYVFFYSFIGTCRIQSEQSFLSCR